MEYNCTEKKKKNHEPAKIKKMSLMNFLINEFKINILWIFIVLIGFLIGFLFGLIILVF